MTYIEDYRKLYLKTVENLIKSGSKGIWSIACSNHVYASKEEYYNVADETVNGLSVQTAIEQFVMLDRLVDAED